MSSPPVRMAELPQTFSTMASAANRHGPAGGGAAGRPRRAPPGSVPSGSAACAGPPRPGCARSAARRSGRRRGRRPARAARTARPAPPVQPARLGRAAEIGAGRQQQRAASSVRLRAEDVQAVADLQLLHVAQIGVQPRQRVVIRRARVRRRSRPAARRWRRDPGFRCAAVAVRRRSMPSAAAYSSISRSSAAASRRAGRQRAGAG